LQTCFESAPLFVARTALIPWVHDADGHIPKNKPAQAPIPIAILALKAN